MSSSLEVTDEDQVKISLYEGESEMGAIMSLIDEELSEPYTVYTYRYFLNQWPQLCFLAHLGPTHDQTTIGVIICKLDRHLKGNRYMRGYIGMLSVQPRHRGKGIATRLLKVALANLVSLGAQEIVLETETDNVSSLRLYENLGFLREKRIFNFYLNGKDCFRLLLEIPEEHWVTSVENVEERHATTPSTWSRIPTEQASPPRHLFTNMRVA
ncbi:hypothetical protein CBS101457_002115 [Exobasidium rhododendri]|nr:hypothetical protein CBS101457_002115 [Exobasidium rhododendri]